MNAGSSASVRAPRSPAAETEFRLCPIRSQSASLTLGTRVKLRWERPLWAKLCFEGRARLRVGRRHPPADAPALGNRVALLSASPNGVYLLSFK